MYKIICWMILNLTQLGHTKPKELCKKIVRAENINNTDYFITGLFPMYSTAVSRGLANGLQYSEVMKYTLEEFNKNSKFKIGYEYYDTCGESQLDLTMGIVTDLLLDDRTVNRTIPRNGLTTSDVTCKNIRSTIKTKIFKSKKSVLCKFIENSSPQRCSCDNPSSSLSDYRVGIIGAASSTVSMRTYEVLACQNLPMISYASTSPTLSKKLYHNFMRTIPSDIFQVQVLIDLILHFKWKYISIIASDNSYGRSGTQELINKLKENNICVGRQIFFGVPYKNKEIQDVVNTLKNDESCQIIVLFALTTASKMVFRNSAQLQLYGRTWLLTEGVVGIGTWVEKIDKKILGGSFAVNPFSGVYKEFEQYFYALDHTNATKNAFLKLYLDTRESSDKSSKLTKMGHYRYQFSGAKIGYVRNAVRAYTTALTNYINDVCLNNKSCDTFPPIRDRRLFNSKYLKNVEFKGLFDETIKFDKHGDILKPYYHILNMQDIEGEQKLRLIGNWSNDILRIQSNLINWSNNQRPSGQCSRTCRPGFYALFEMQKKCCWVCVPCMKGYVKTSYGESKRCKLCPEDYKASQNGSACLHINKRSININSTYGVIIIILVITGIIVSLVVFNTFFKFRHTLYVRTANMYLSFVQVSIQMLLFLSFLLVFAERTQNTCAVQLYSAGATSSIVFAIILIKTELLYRIFKCKHRISIAYRRLTFKLQIIIIGSICFIYTTLQVLVNVLGRPVAIKETYIASTNTMILICDHNDNLISTLLYLIVLSGICGVQAYRTRQLPHLFNDGRHIMYAVFISSLCMILTVFITLYAPNIPEKSFMLYIFIFITNITLLSVMYGYKIWTIWFRPHKNNRQAIPVFKLKTKGSNRRKTMLSVMSPTMSSSRSDIAELQN